MKSARETVAENRLSYWHRWCRIETRAGWASTLTPNGCHTCHDKISQQR